MAKEQSTAINLRNNKEFGYTVSVKIDVKLFADNDKMAKDKGIKVMIQNVNEKYLSEFVEVQKEKNISKNKY